MKIERLAFVGTPVTDMKRAREFYEGILGLRVAAEMMGGQWVEYSLGENDCSWSRARRRVSKISQGCLAQSI